MALSQPGVTAELTSIQIGHKGREIKPCIEVNFMCMTKVNR